MTNLQKRETHITARHGGRFIVLSKDIFSIPKEQLPATKLY